MRHHWRKHHFYAHFNFVSSNRILNARAPMIISPPTSTTIAAIIAIAFVLFTAIGYILHDAIEKLFFFSSILLTKLCYVFPSDTIFWTLSLSFCSSIFHRSPIGFRVMFFCLILSLLVCLSSPVLWIVVRCLPLVFLVAHPLCHAMCLLVRCVVSEATSKMSVNYFRFSGKLPSVIWLLT